MMEMVAGHAAGAAPETPQQIAQRLRVYHACMGPGLGVRISFRNKDMVGAVIRSIELGCAAEAQQQQAQQLRAEFEGRLRALQLQADALLRQVRIYGLFGGLGWIAALLMAVL